jgi:hypothetical protein
MGLHALLQGKLCLLLLFMYALTTNMFLKLYWDHEQNSYGLETLSLPEGNMLPLPAYFPTFPSCHLAICLTWMLAVRWQPSQATNPLGFVCDCGAIAYFRYCHLGQCFTEPSDYYDAPINKVLHFIQSVGLIKSSSKGEAQYIIEGRSARAGFIVAHPYSFIHSFNPLGWLMWVKRSRRGHNSRQGGKASNAVFTTTNGTSFNILSIVNTQNITWSVVWWDDTCG